MNILHHSGLAFVEFSLLLLLVTWLLLDKDVNERFWAGWTTLGLLMLAALAHTPSHLSSFLYLPFFLSPWAAGCTLLAAVILREYRREDRLARQKKKGRGALWAGALTAVSAGLLCWSVQLGGLGAPLLFTSFIVLGYCAQANRKI